MSLILEDGSGEPFKTDLKTRPKILLEPKPKTWAIRAICSVILILYFCLTVYVGPILIIATTIAIQFKSFKEITNVAFTIYPVEKLPWFKFMSWYFLLSFNYFFGGESLINYFGAFVKYCDCLKVLVVYHRFISFCLYFVGMVWFMLRVSVNYDKDQYSFLACTHVAILILATQSYMIVRNIFQGMIWLIVPVTAVVCNDIMAYVCGILFGKTPLIKLSPKKTVEGFLGAAICTMFYTYFISFVLCRYQYLTCPIEYKLIDGSIKMLTSCMPNDIYQWTTYSFKFKILKETYELFEFQHYPFVIHALSIGLFASLIAPFGGFFASGFKRAFKVKDFGSIIPGHGGIVDRFDCQFLVATFVNVYITSFIQSHTVNTLLERVLNLNNDQQLEVYNMLKELTGNNVTTI